MKLIKKCLSIIVILFFVPSSIVSAGFEYKSYRDHKGGDITPLEAYRMVKASPQKVFLIDVRTRSEYQFVGHAEGARNIPFMFFSNDIGSMGYKFTPNPDFTRELLALFNPKTDVLLIYCKSGGRSLMAVEAAIGAGFPETNVYNIMGGFEGDPDRNAESIYYDKPYYGGWIREGLPWTYKMDNALMYQPDLRK